MAETRKVSLNEVREALEKHTGEKIEDLEIQDEHGNKVRGGIALSLSPEEMKRIETLEAEKRL